MHRLRQQSNFGVRAFPCSHSAPPPEGQASHAAPGPSVPRALSLASLTNSTAISTTPRLEIGVQAAPFAGRPLELGRAIAVANLAQAIMPESDYGLLKAPIPPCH